MRSLLLLSASSALAIGTGAVFVSNAAAQPAPMSDIGPMAPMANSFVGVPSHLTLGGRGWAFDFPYPSPRAGHVNYVTTRSGPLVGKSRIVLRYRIDAVPGVRIVPGENPGVPATLTLFFQRRGDSWSGRGRYEHYRWFATHANRVPLAPGEHEVSLTLDGRHWKSVMSATGADVPVQFRDALQNAERVGFVLGGGGSAGHGVYATGPARFTVIGFRVI